MPRVVLALPAPGDGAAGLAATWDAGRTDDVSHLRLPTLVGGVAADEARAPFVRFCAARPDATDGLRAWAGPLI